MITRPNNGSSSSSGNVVNETTAATHGSNRGDDDHHQLNSDDDDRDGSTSSSASAAALTSASGVDACHYGERLPVSFFRRKCVWTISQELLGMYVLTRDPTTRIVTGGMIVETEAYGGADDRACHAYGLRRTARTEVMYANGGVGYVFLCYGCHEMLNVVTSVEGEPHAILIRAIEPKFGLDEIVARRRKPKEQKKLNRVLGGERLDSHKQLNFGWKELAKLGSGPGCVTKCLAVDRSMNGLDFSSSDRLWIAYPRGHKFADSPIPPDTEKQFADSPIPPDTEKQFADSPIPPDTEKQFAHSPIPPDTETDPSEFPPVIGKLAAVSNVEVEDFLDTLRWQRCDDDDNDEEEEDEKKKIENPSMTLMAGRRHEDKNTAQGRKRNRGYRQITGCNDDDDGEEDSSGARGLELTTRKLKKRRDDDRAEKDPTDTTTTASLSPSSSSSSSSFTALGILHCEEAEKRRGGAGSSLTSYGDKPARDDIVIERVDDGGERVWRVGRSARVGVDFAGHDALLPWRYFLVGHPSVSGTKQMNLAGTKQMDLAGTK